MKHQKITKNTQWYSQEGQGPVKAELKMNFAEICEPEPFSLYFSPVDPNQIGKGITLITVLDVNDNAPVFAIDYETLLCENSMPGQVRPRDISVVGLASFLLFFPSLSVNSLEVWHTKTACWASQPLKLSPPSKQLHCAQTVSVLQLRVTPGGQHH